MSIGESRSPINSAVVIARLLSTEGYSDFVHNQVERYWRRNIMEQRKAKKLERVEKEFSELMRDMTEAEKLLIGRFISWRSQMSFDTGMRIGMQAFAHIAGKNGHDIIESKASG